MFLMTHHRQLVARDGAGRLVQCDYSPDVALVEVDEADIGRVISRGPLAGYRLLQSARGLHLCRNQYFLCAAPKDRYLLSDQVKRADDWETFALVSETGAKSLIPRQPETERARFAARVAALAATGDPVKVYCGAGNAPRPGFLNIDITEFAPEFGAEHRDEYFIFPFADMAWGIPDDSVDYVFHEDFLEHITQLQQVQFLAETWRVLRRGGWHRVNTPNLLWSMRKHSDFSKGFSGVYTGERDIWGHVCLMTPGALEDMAKLVGYRRVVFNGKGRGLSPLAAPDLRPDYDRDQVDGNVIADLEK